MDCILPIKGVGSFYSELFKEGAEPLSQQKPIKMQNHTDPSQLKVVEGVEKVILRIQPKLKSKPSLDLIQTLWQSKLSTSTHRSNACVLASGQADIYLRLPVSDTYREKIWDHAAGNILIYESGGQVGDVTGAPLNFGNGRTLDSKGVIAANKEIFDKVIDAVTEVRKSSTPRV